MSREQIPTRGSANSNSTIGAFRCLNCFTRISPPPGVKTHRCPHCGYEWRVSWIAPDIPRIRGPVWDTNRRLAEEESGKKQAARG